MLLVLSNRNISRYRLGCRLQLHPPLVVSTHDNERECCEDASTNHRIGVAFIEHPTHHDTDESDDEGEHEIGFDFHEPIISEELNLSMDFGA